MAVTDKQEKVSKLEKMVSMESKVATHTLERETHTVVNPEYTQVESNRGWECKEYQQELEEESTRAS